MHINGINQLNSTTQCKDFHNVKVNTIIWVYGGHSPIHMGWYYVTHINPWWIGEELIFPVVLETEGKLCWALKLAISTQRPGPPQEHDSTPRRLVSVYPRQATHVLFRKNGHVESDCNLNNVNPHIIRN